ncbi:alpha/beta fold hydrolase [Actinoplanes lobatus]|uniref:Pimeloyl-ACP methyl ester carboxylesterase n=1 Tax=Actinoplanes lobatus TaxID=113568 RepID=A0A7W7HK21_9ACTN|nr:alpha/beta hydrolase [Actinoplanes lobatus]MBB4751978.1 pimeloyl-ACP methyl ester carboxylesterase [Actinoplanes lobatus]
MTAATYFVSYRSAKDVPIEVRRRDQGGELIAFLHGFGCARESFDEAFRSDALLEYSLLTFDLPEHGRSGSLGAHAGIEGAADAVTSLLRRTHHERVHLVCHSMGGAIGLLAAQDLGTRMGDFISVEGNLIAEDCGLVTRGVAEQEATEFNENGFARFVAGLKKSAELSHRLWAEWYERCSPLGLHSLAGSLVQSCDNDKLVDLLTELESAHYLYGARSEIGHLTHRLRGIPMHSIDRSGHFPMIDNPADFYSLIAAVLTTTGAASPAVSASFSG